MKTTKRGQRLMLACAGLVAFLVCLPLLWFRVQDAQLFGTAQQVDSLYESRTVTGDDFYLLQQVKNRTSYIYSSLQIAPELSTSVSMYSPAGNTRNDMTLSTGAVSFAANLLSQLNSAGALPDAWYHAAADGLTSYGCELYTSSDSLGITRVLRYPRSASEADLGSEDEDCPVFALDYDNKTGGLLALWIQSPLESYELPAGSSDETVQDPLLTPLDSASLLNSWVQWEGLSDLNDWTAPLGSDYADTGLYSASGSTLLTCVNGTFTLGSQTRAYFSMQLNWMPYSPAPQPGDVDLLPETTTASDVLPAYYSAVPSFCQSDDGTYDVDYTFCLILRTDLQTGVQDVFCNVPGCTHMTDSCPARISGSSFSLTAADDCVYLVFNGFASALSSSFPGQDMSLLSDDELMRWVQASSLGIPLSLYAQEPEPYTQEDVASARSWLSAILDQSRIEVLDGTTRKELVHLDNQDLSISYCDDTYLYGLLRDHTASQPLRWFRMERATGQYETFPLPESSELCGIWNHQLVLLRDRSSEPVHTNDFLALTQSGSVDAVQQNIVSEVILYDPATAQCSQIYSLSSSNSDITPLAVYDNTLCLGVSFWDNVYTTQDYVVRFDLATGVASDLSSALGLPYTGYHYGYFRSAPPGWLAYYTFSDDGSSGETRLFNLSSGKLSSISWQSYNSCLPAAEAPDSRLLLLYRDSDSDQWQQYLAPVDDLSDLTPVSMWSPGA